MPTWPNQITERMKNKSTFLIAGFLTIPGLVQAQEVGQSLIKEYQTEISLTLAIIICAVALLALLVAWSGMRAVLGAKMKDETGEGDTSLITAFEGEEHLGFWGRLISRMNYSGSIEEESSVATEHVYDDIRELDNKLPPWWVYLFYITIIFAVVYYLHYETLGTGASQAEEYEAEMAQAEADVQTYLASLDNVLDETNVTLSTDQVDLDAGQAIYETNCAVCHVADGGGGVGPNFTDKYWIHGGDIPSIFTTIKYGVPAKGMIAWESQLSAKQMQQVASYIYNMEGTTSANPKDPQGELFERGGEASAVTESTEVAMDADATMDTEATTESELAPATEESKPAENQVDLSAGKATYETLCAACHLADGGGMVGPNLTDKYWINGGDMPSIIKVITEGVPAKGMIPWAGQLTPEQIEQVAAYIYSLEGTTPATPKAAEGELYERQ